jgi:hypothetical protein
MRGVRSGGEGRKAAASIAIPLKPREKPVDLPQDYQRSLRNELDVRYLESIGAAPSKANIAMVRRHIPADKCKITTAWKSRGWHSDMLFINLQDPSQAPSVVAARRHREAQADIGAIDRLPMALMSSGSGGAEAGAGAGGDADEDAAFAVDDDAKTELQLSAPSGSMSFDDGQRSFLYPYRHLSAPPTARRTRVDDGSPRARPRSPTLVDVGGRGAGRGRVGGVNDGDDEDELAETEEDEEEEGAWSIDGDEQQQREDGATEEAGESPAGGGGASAVALPSSARGALPPISPRASPSRRGKYDFRSRDVQRFAPFTEREVLEELAMPLELHTREILQLQLDFLQSFPFERVRAPQQSGVHASAHDKTDVATAAAAREEIASPRTARFIGMLSLFLYRFHMRERCRQPRDDAKLGALVCAVQQYFAALRRRMMPKRRLVLIVLPALLLSARMSVEALFRGAFKKWWTTIDGRETLKRMDAMIEEMFDPNMYHSHIAPLESTTEAIKIASRQEIGVKPAGNRQARYFTTSTLISTAMPHAPLVKHRRNLAGPSYPRINEQLGKLASTSVRQSLMQAARTRPSPEQATADASRLVEGMIARPKQQQYGTRAPQDRAKLSAAAMRRTL